MSKQPEQTATFRFHGALNDFLSKHRKRQVIHYAFRGAPAIKDAIEALGVPHPEVDVVLVNGMPVLLSYALHPDDVVEVYPVEEGRSWPAGYTFVEQHPPKTRQYFHEFYRCPFCSRIYWKGSHYERMQQYIAKIRRQS
ncbi:Mut7-C RNAse domain-containing protein [uncultured Pontibacter sp.]|uniref:Mut7-C RNAse domain-containing protein n=1 Tax=uncultured Pontibacter sp. TaxID=453356 RepID=UPI00260C1E57|nr:Mut7-C RNAse domain-containing protein [uncultured Pontibacter sp.]